MISAMAIAKLISDACLDAEKLPEALIACGLLEAVVAIELIIRKARDGILLRDRVVLLCLYYTFLIAALIVGFFKIFAGFWVSDDFVGRRAAGKKILQYTVVSLVLMLAFASAK
jgi:hypothetical protein